MSTHLSLQHVVSELVDTLVATSDERHERLSLLSKDLFKIVQAGKVTAEEAWNALCLLWHHYEALKNGQQDTSGAAGSGTSVNCWETGDWQPVHQACQLLVSQAKGTAETRQHRMVQAQLHYDSAKVRQVVYECVAAACMARFTMRPPSVMDRKSAAEP